jgi:excisionase family DNA binding protein
MARLVAIEGSKSAKQEFEPNLDTTSLLRPTYGEYRSNGTPYGMEVLLTSKEASQVLKIHPKVLERMAKRGGLPALKVGKFWRYRATTLDAWINSRLQSGSQPCRTATSF